MHFYPVAYSDPSSSDEISKEDESALEHEYESKYTEYLSEFAQLLKAG